jgi:TolB-like protein/DNA-binding winged helix-turn-helix (wHTH) protein
MTTARIASFGHYAVDLRSGELRKCGTKVKMGEQPFQILLLLLENHGELVTREELRSKLWAHDTFVDFDHGLNSAVQRLRDCLSDTAERPLWVETIPRRGYRFAGPVEWSDIANLTPINGMVAPLPGEIGSAGTPQVSVDQPISPPAPGREWRFPGAAIWIVIVSALLLVWPLYKYAPTRKIIPSGVSVQIRSIAILPLENLSGDPAQDYLADGMTDELITTLAKHRELRITSRGSVTRFKQAHRPTNEIARELGVEGIILGSVVRSGQKLRVNAQLIRPSDDTVIWSESYDRDATDLFLLQAELARTIAEQVRVTSSSTAVPSVSAAARFNPEAHDNYLRGRYYWFKFDLAKSREFFQKAIDLDPAYAPSYSGLGDTYMAGSLLGEMPAKDGMPIGEAAVRKALEIDDSLPEAHNSLAAAKIFYRWDWVGAEAHHLYAHISSLTNRVPECLREERISQELDPFIRSWALAGALYRQRRFDEAIQEINKQIVLDPASPGFHEQLSQAYYSKGMLREAVAEEEKSLELRGDLKSATVLEQLYKSGGYNATLEWHLDALKSKAKDHYVSPVKLAEICARLGRQDEAFIYLEQAFDQHNPALVWLKQNLYFDPLHPDPRYQALVEAIGLP